MRLARRLRVPPGLAPGARIAVVAPGSPPRPDALDAGLERLRSWGYEPIPGRALRARRGDLAGEDEARLEDLLWAFGEPGIGAVWAARGGWGLPRLLDALERREPRIPNDRLLLGFSDLTPLLLCALASGVVPLHAPLVAELGQDARYDARDLRRRLAHPRGELAFRAGKRRALTGGVAEGPLVGGCLTLLAALAGTRWQPRLDGALLFIEEVSEAPYRIDRLLWQLRESGTTRGVSGLVVGQLHGCRPAPGRPSRSLRGILVEHAEAIGVPALAGLPIGHGPRTRTLPLGFRGLLDADAGTLTLQAPGRGG